MECSSSRLERVLEPNCCKSIDGNEVAVGGNKSMTSMANKIELAGGVFKFAGDAGKEVYGAIKAGQSLSAATGGLKEMVIGAFDPSSLALSVGFHVVMEVLGKQCSEEDMTTSLLRDNRFCVEVGEYCSEELPIVGCIETKKSYCCFNTRLARAVHEQGRKQLNSFSGFGSADNPNCRGFKPDEFELLDFSKIDLSEFMDELLEQAKMRQGDVEKKMGDKVDSFMSERNMKVK